MAKMIAPIVITILVILVILGYMLAIVAGLHPLANNFPFNLIFIGLIIGLFLLLGTMIYILIQRLKEIKEEDQDDISKY